MNLESNGKFELNMKHILHHIIGFIFLLSLVGVKTLDIIQSNSSFKNLLEKTTTSTFGSSTNVEYKLGKGHSSIDSLTSIEIDNNDVQFSDQLILIAKFCSIILCAISIHFIVHAIKRRRIFYKAFIQLFSYKYIVFCTLRI